MSRGMVRGRWGGRWDGTRPLRAVSFQLSVTSSKGIRVGLDPLRALLNWKLRNWKLTKYVIYYRPSPAASCWTSRDRAVVEAGVVAEISRREVDDRGAHADHAVGHDRAAGEDARAFEPRLQLIGREEGAVGADERVPGELLGAVDVPGGVAAAHAAIGAGELGIGADVDE